MASLVRRVYRLVVKHVGRVAKALFKKDFSGLKFKFRPGHYVVSLSKTLTAFVSVDSAE